MDDLDAARSRWIILGSRTIFPIGAKLLLGNVVCTVTLPRRGVSEFN